MNPPKSIKISILALIFSILPIFGHSGEKTYGDLVVSKLIKVYDGDTITVNIDAITPILGQKISIRIDGIDAPEIRGTTGALQKKAQLAQNTVYRLLKTADTILLRNIKRGKYFRLISEVYADGVNVGQYLIDHNLAKPYDGGKKEAWE